MLYNAKEQKYRRKQLRNEPTVPESVLWQSLRNKKIEGFKFRRQFGINNYILDFYCPEIKLCVELDGNVHDDINSSNYDEVRNNFLNANGIYVIRFENRLVFESYDDVVGIIKITALKLLNHEISIATRIVTKYNDCEYTYEKF